MSQSIENVKSAIYSANQPKREQHEAKREETRHMDSQTVKDAYVYLLGRAIRLRRTMPSMTRILEPASAEPEPW